MTEKVKRDSVRIWLWISLATVAASAAVSSRSLILTLRGFRNAEASGFVSVGRGIAKANQLFLGGLYVGLFCVLIAIILHLRSSNPLPVRSVWSSLLASTLTLGLVLTLWIAESIMISALPLSRAGVVVKGTIIDRLLLITLCSGGILAGLLLAGSIAKISSVGAPQTRSGNLVFFVALALGVVAVAFHIRNASINAMYEQFM
jgi:hypothetical protein